MSLDQPSRRALVTGLVGTLGVGGAYYLTRSDDTAHDLSPSFHSSDETSQLGVELRGKPIMGASDASLELYYWTDFQCPFCEQFERETLPDPFESTSNRASFESYSSRCRTSVRTR